MKIKKEEEKCTNLLKINKNLTAKNDNIYYSLYLIYVLCLLTYIVQFLCLWY